MGMYVYKMYVYVNFTIACRRFTRLIPASTEANAAVRWVTIDDVPDIAFNMCACWTGLSRSHADVRVHSNDHGAVS